MGRPGHVIADGFGGVTAQEYAAGVADLAEDRLGMLGMAEGTPAQTIEMRVWTFVYFGFFVLLFFLSPKMKTKPVPERLTH